MVSAEASTPLPRVGHPQPVERTLHGAILAPRPMQCDPHAVEALGGQVLHRPVQGIEGMRIHAAPLQGREHRIAAQQ